MNNALALVFIFELPILIIALVIKYAIKGIIALDKAAKTSHASPPPAKEATAALSQEQREKIVTVILEDSLLLNDTAWDSLLYEGEAIYPAADACLCDAKEFDLQYGSEAWQSAWANALSAFFDCQSEYEDVGNFRLFGKEA